MSAVETLDVVLVRTDGKFGLDALVATRQQLNGHRPNSGTYRTVIDFSLYSEGILFGVFPVDQIQEQVEKANEIHLTLLKAAVAEHRAREARGREAVGALFDEAERKKQERKD